MNGQMNDSQDQGQDQGMDDSAEMIIPYNEQDFPNLQGLKEGSKVSFDGEATLVNTNGGMGLKISNINCEPSDNEATSELNRMTGKYQSMKPMVSSGGSKGF